MTTHITPVVRKRSQARGQFLAGLLTTAVENGGTGWFFVHEYRWQGLAPEAVHAVISDMEDDDPETMTVTIDVMATGLAVIRNAIVATSDEGTYMHNAETFERLGFGGSPRDELLLSDRTNGDDGDYDVIGALAVLECGLFGTVVYG